MSEKNYMVQLDGLRVLAVGAVMFAHWTLVIKGLRNFGYFTGPFGVNLFFVLSGFLITGILIRSRHGSDTPNQFILRQFYIRRFLRIFPLYYLALVIGLLFAIPTVRDRIAWFASYMANWFIGAKAGEEAAGYYTYLWSLAVEEQFYIFFPLLFLLGYRRHAKKILIALVITGVVTRTGIVCYGLAAHWSMKSMIWPTYVDTPCCIDSFGAGALLAWCKFHFPRQTLSYLRHRFNYIAAVVCLILLVLVKLYPGHIVPDIAYLCIGRLLFAIAGVWMVGLASYADFKGPLKAFLENKTVVFLGKISYGLYVYHLIVMYFLQDLHLSHSVYGNFFATRTLMLVVTIGVSVCSWFFFEKPFNDAKRFFEYKAVPTAPPTPIPQPSPSLSFNDLDHLSAVRTGKDQQIDPGGQPAGR